MNDRFGPPSTWHKSSHSQGSQNCVEVSPGCAVGIRDTNARERGRLTVTPRAFAALVSLAKRSR